MNTNNVAPVTADNTRTVARNSLWYGLDVSFGLVTAFGLTIAIANVIGPDRLSYYNYIGWLTNVSVALGTCGMPATTRKYMAESLNRGEPGVARATYLATLRIQACVATTVWAVAIAMAFLLGRQDYFLITALLITAVPARLIATVPSQANNAAESMRWNTGPSIIGTAATVALSVVSLIRDWGLPGLAAALVVGSYLECLMKLISVERWLGHAPRAALPPELRRRMFTYSGQGLALMVLNVVVWDRSDLLILKAMNSDPRQITFFSYAFTLAERALLIPTMFSGALSATIMAQFGRGQDRLKKMTVDGGRYALLMALPLLGGLACISRPLITVLYVKSYQPMIPTLAFVALFAIPKALVTAPTILLQTVERQVFLIVWGCICGMVDLGLDFALTPGYGASGAAFANGIAQTLAALGIWVYASKIAELDLGLRDFGRIALSGAIMAAGVMAFLHVVPGPLGLVGGIFFGAALWMGALRLTSALRPEDAGRLLLLGGQFPAALRPYWKRSIEWLAPARAAETAA